MSVLAVTRMVSCSQSIYYAHVVARETKNNQSVHVFTHTSKVFIWIYHASDAYTKFVRRQLPNNQE